MQRLVSRWMTVAFTCALIALPRLVASRPVRAASACVGDCAGDGEVTIDDLVKGVSLALGGGAIDTCRSFDVNGDGAITIDEIISGVNAALSACAAAVPTPTPTPPATPTRTPSGVTLLFNFDVSNPGNPFPSDRLLDATGHVSLPPAYLNSAIPPASKYNSARAFGIKIAGQLTALDGFATFAPIRIRFSRPMVVEQGENPHGFLVLEYNNLDARPALMTATAYEPDSNIELQPIVPLKPKTTYALIATTDLTDVDGNHVKPSADFSQLLAGTNLTADQAAWRGKLQPVISFVQDAFGIDSDSLALVDLFTTEHTTDDMQAIQHRLHDGTDLVPGAPCFANCALKNFETGIFAENTQEYRDLIGSYTSNNVSAVGIGVFDSYDFRTGPKGSFDPRFVNGPDVPGVNHLDFYVTIPKGPKPPNGYPLAVFGHGLGGSGRDVGQIASLNTTAPVMGLAISAVQHGTRGNVVNFFVLDDIATTRENFRQSVADFLQLTKMAQDAHAAGIPPFDMIDPQSLLYIGGSLGGIMGTLYMAVEPDVQVGVLSVPGGGLTNILDSIDIGGLLQPLIGLLAGVPGNDPFFPEFFHGFRQTAQWGIESGDPINYGPYIVTPGAQLPGVPPKRILMHEGIVDSTVPNRTTDDLALAMQLPSLNASHGCHNPDGCSGIWRFVMTDYGQDETGGHPVTVKVPQATQQAFDYLLSFGTVVDDVHP